MKILFVSASPLEYSASSNMRNIALLKGFISLGHEVYTLTPRPQTDSKLYDETICDIDIKDRFYIEMGAMREKITMKKNSKNTIKKIIYKYVSKFKMYDFRSSLAKKQIKINEKFDIVISSSDPKSSHLIAEQLIKNNEGIGKKWIQYWGDPFATDINKKTLLPKFLVKKEEERLISLADNVIYVSPFTLEKQISLYPKHKNKMIFLPIAFIKTKIYEETHNDKITIGYFGDYSLDRNILPLYEAVASDITLKLNICGNSIMKLGNKDNIDIRPRQKVSVIEELEKEADILVCVCNRKGTQIPGKAYHYAATNKAILIIVDGENSEKITKYFKDYNRYYICNNNKDDIIQNINKIKKEKMKYSPLERLMPENIVKELLGYITPI